MTNNTTSPRRRRTTNTTINSNPSFLQVALSPYRRGDPENNIVINTRTIQQVSPPTQLKETNLATGDTKISVPDPRYMVTFKAGHGTQEYGRAIHADLVAAGIPIPPGRF